MEYIISRGHKHVPIDGVAKVCRPTSWAGPSPSRKSLNWLSAANLTPGKIKLEITLEKSKKINTLKFALCLFVFFICFIGFLFIYLFLFIYIGFPNNF